MGKRNKYKKKPCLVVSADSNAWVMSNKCEGDSIAGWIVERLFVQNTRFLLSSERCAITAFCYPTGAKLVRAKLQRVLV
jgi:hypothetical protein